MTSRIPYTSMHIFYNVGKAYLVELIVHDCSIYLPFPHLAVVFMCISKLPLCHSKGLCKIIIISQNTYIMGLIKWAKVIKAKL